MSHEMYATHMRQALELAEQGRGWTSPNPIVGAVIVKDGAVIAKGYHQNFGGPHAEIHALKEAGEQAKGSTLYVTLEPCTHFGKTPPCTDAILAAGIAKVVVGAPDPNPKAAGGAALLQGKGLEVVTGVLEEACKFQNAPFYKFMRTGFPLVTAKWAMSADGKIATNTGDSRWITSAQARAHAHTLRARNDAVIVGIGTVLNDAPLLTVRMGIEGRDTHHWQPRRVVLDTQARMPWNAPLWTAEKGGPITIFVSKQAPEDRIKLLEEKGAEVIALEEAREHLPVKSVLRALGERGVTSVLIEGGAAVLGSCVDQRVVDRAHIFIAPKIIGGTRGLTAVTGRGVDFMHSCPTMRVDNVQTLGPDVLIEAHLGEWDWLE